MGEDSGGRSLDALLGEIARAPDVAPAESLVGKTLGRYRIDALLGRGGMGVVYRAHDTTLARDVALKLLPPELVGDGERRARFVREAKLAAAVTHPCTAAVYDVGEHDGNVFLAMELVRGKTLRAALDEHPSGMPIAEVTRIGADIARGLAKAHDTAIVHRDLKPENVMLDDEGHVKILDFGLAKLRESEGGSMTSTEAGRVLGTPSYMSPEQAKGKRVDARSDLFSLGIVLYEMLTAKRPFVGESTVEVLIAIDRDPPPPLASVRKGVPSAIIAIVDRCLAKDPASRWESARDLAGALRGVVSEAPARPHARSGTWIVVAALAGAAAAGVLWNARRGHEGPTQAQAASAPETLAPPTTTARAEPPAASASEPVVASASSQPPPVASSSHAPTPNVPRPPASASAKPRASASARAVDPLEGQN